MTEAERQEPTPSDPCGSAGVSERFPEKGSDPGLLREFAEFLRTNKKWWMAPIIAVILLLSVLVAFAASPAAPFIYTLF